MGTAPLLMIHRMPSTRGTLATVFADSPDTFTAETMMATLNPKLKKLLDEHPNLAKQFATEMNQQLEEVRKDPNALKALREEMEADVKDLNEQVDKDPEMLKMI